MADVSPSHPSPPSPSVDPTSPGALTELSSQRVVAGTKNQYKIIDVREIFPANTVTAVEPESKEERRHRLAEAAKDASEKRLHGRVKMATMGLTYLALFVLVTYMALWGTPDQQKWGLDGLKMIISAAGGILIGRAL
ncbi:hypothetical protein [Hyalangium minutum]|uniref:Uncharacterized protein n=1 Tax=Hyalangium minutum TaxID=394096 RepID=A0A085WSY3_9BACT|nr:hypothetical protein [Hyalangium minutum]KFE70796.1 hypothetical protein DB31_5838 [Hyalangium minutum]